MTTDELDEMAVDVLSTLDGAPAALLAAFAMGLELADRPAREFARAIESLSVDVESAGSGPGQLTRLAMRHALRRSALEGSLIVRLSNAQEPFWRRVGDAVTTIAEDLLPA